MTDAFAAQGKFNFFQRGDHNESAERRLHRLQSRLHYRCYFCLKTGHMEKDCPQREKTQTYEANAHVEVNESVTVPFSQTGKEFRHGKGPYVMDQ